MTTLAHIPDPQGSSVKTVSYTIPAGKYARAIPLGWFCTMNGVEVARAYTKTKTITSNLFPLPLGRWSEKPTLIDLVENSGSATLSLIHVLGRKVSQTVANDKTFWSTISSHTVSTSGIIVDLASGNGYATSGALGSLGPSDSDTTMDFEINKPYLAAALSVSANWTINIKEYEELPKELWVPAGTVLDGGNWLVEEYI